MEPIPLAPRVRRPLPRGLDHNAATPVREVALAAYLAALVHDGPDAMTAALHRLADVLGVPVATLHPAVGGSAAAAAALQGLCAAQPPGNIVVSGLEHAAVSGTVAQLVATGRWTASRPDTGADGRVSVAAVAAALRPDTRVVALTAACSETGVVQPLAAVAALLRPRGIALFTDATQAMGRLPHDDAGTPMWSADVTSWSAHKVGALGGLGVVYVRPGVAFHMPPLLRHDDCAAALAALAAALAAPVAWEAVAQQRDALEAALRAALPEVRVVGAASPRLPQTSCLQVAGCRGDALLMALDLAGWALSTGSACRSGAVSPSPALLSMGLTPDAARSCVRMSLGPDDAALDIAALAAAFVTAARRLRAVAVAAG